MIEGEQGTHSDHTDDGSADAPPYESDVQTRDISEDSADRHQGEFAEIAKRIFRVLEKTGVMHVFKEHPDLSFDEAFEHVHGRRRRSRFLNDLLCSLFEVHRSVQAATSPREDLIGTIIGVQPALELISWFLVLYGKFRAHEIPVEIAWDAALGHEAVHNDEHDAFVQREIRGCVSDLSAVITRLRGLCAALAKERTVAVNAKMYSDTGGGCEAELALRMDDRGASLLRVGLLLRRIKVPGKNVKGARRKNLMRSRFSDLVKAVAKQVERARAITTKANPN